MPAVLKVLGVPDRSHERARCNRADAGDPLELATCFAVAVRCLDLGLELADLGIEFLEVIEQALDQQSEAAWQLIAGILDEFAHAAQDVG
ncbi:hypothetical protein D9M69_377310 [compost metagenome]